MITWQMIMTPKAKAQEAPETVISDKISLMTVINAIKQRRCVGEHCEYVQRNSEVLKERPRKQPELVLRSGKKVVETKNVSDPGHWYFSLNGLLVAELKRDGATWQLINAAGDSRKFPTLTTAHEFVSAWAIRYNIEKCGGQHCGGFYDE